MPARFNVGDVFRLERTCDPYRPIYYAGASGDFNPIHIDPEAGKRANLGGTILQGLCTMAWATDCAAQYLGDPGLIRDVRVRFSRPVAAGDVIQLQGTVTRIEAGRLTAKITARNQRGEDVLKGVVVEASIADVNPGEA